MTTDLSSTLDTFRPDPDLQAPVLAQRAVQLARVLQERGSELQTSRERHQQRELERIMQSPHDKATLMQLTDQGLRSRRADRAVDQLIHILDVQGVPGFFTALDRTLLKGLQRFGDYLPRVAVPLVREKLLEETANVVLPAEEPHLLPYLRARREAGLRMNLNLLGEALLGEEAVGARLDTYLQALRRPEVECISVKISTLYSQGSPLAWEDTVAVLCRRLERLYRVAAGERFRRMDGSEVPKFVYLDMEEYRDMRVTAEVFMATLDRPGMSEVRAGIALQAYLPDAFSVQREINAWARRRVAAGAAPVTLRLVKGANLAMERVEASVHGWPQAPFKSKREVDANFRRMLQEGLCAENIPAVGLGIASHNLFDLCYGLLLAREKGALDKVQFEMLEGMANHQRRALLEVVDNLLLYAPATRQEHFVQAIGYLVRRLDENTGPDNFLSHAFKLEVDSPEWRRLAADFYAAFESIDSLPDAPRRTQDRRVPPTVPRAAAAMGLEAFANEPDTDFSLPQNVEWARSIIERWRSRHGPQALDIPLVIAGEPSRDEEMLRECLDPSRPDVVVGHYREAGEQDLERALAMARADPAGWRGLAPARRAGILGDVAQALRVRRGDLMGAAMANCAKTLPESDAEVSEAVDFVDYYRRAALAIQGLATVRASPCGVVAVVAPWNFPISIPCGGIAAALSAGNGVIFKPSSDAVLVAYELCRCFWEAGVPREALQFMPCSGGDVGARLVAHPGVDGVILTGGTETARRMLAARPDMHLMAETGGKNATIVTALADRDQAVAHIMHSAFSHSGQKCSATSLLVLEEEVYDDPAFESALCDAARSLPVGPAWERRTRVVPLIRPPAGALALALTTLNPGERWALEPVVSKDNPNLVTPGIKWGVQPGSFMHMTELFGPVLAVMKARDLEHAVDLVNQTGYGLTSGIESLDEREQRFWRDRIRAGNLYINRVTTGAVVLRQPFGGMGKSAFGPGIKTAGPNYVAQLMDFEDRKAPAASQGFPDPLLEDLRQRLDSLRAVPGSIPPDAIHRVLAAMASYRRNMDREFGREHDHFHLLGQDNVRRYLPVDALRLRLHPADDFFDLFARVAAARVAGCGIALSLPPGLSIQGLGMLRDLLPDWSDVLLLIEESDADLVAAMRAGETERLRYAAADRVPAPVLEAARGGGQFVARAPVLMEGRVELLWYLREQSISHDYHRYGNLGESGAEGRAEPA